MSSKIDLEYPYSSDWKCGYLVTNKENRRHIVLYNSPTDRTTTAYARYLLSVSLGRYLSENEHVDHIDNNKTNDVLSNLQLVTQADNNRKAAKLKGRQVAEIRCPICGTIFTRRKGNTQAVEIHKGKVTCCSKECRDKFLSLPLTKDERDKVSEETLLRIYTQHGPKA